MWGRSVGCGSGYQGEEDSDLEDEPWTERQDTLFQSVCLLSFFHFFFFEKIINYPGCFLLIIDSFKICKPSLVKYLPADGHPATHRQSCN